MTELDSLPIKGQKIPTDSGTSSKLVLCPDPRYILEGDFGINKKCVFSSQSH